MTVYADFDKIREAIGEKRATHNAKPPEKPRVFGDGCAGCRYYRKLSGTRTDSIKVCHHCHDTGVSHRIDENGHCMNFKKK